MMKTNGISKPRDGKKIYFKRGNTQNIIDVIVKTVQNPRIVEDVQRFVLDNRLSGSLEDLYRLWHFVRFEIKYKEDGGAQLIQYPSALWKSKIGDCKSKTVFIIACLETLGIDWIVRFATYDPSSKVVSHVYPVAVIGGREIILDAVWHEFNNQKEPAYQVKNISKMEVATISGIGTQNYYYGNGVGSLKSLGKKIKKKFRDMVLKKALHGFILPFADFPLKGKTLAKKEKQVKILNWLSEKFDIPQDELLKQARAKIKKKFKKEPEEILAALVAQGRGVHGIGCIEPASFIACLTALAPIIAGIIIQVNKARAEKDGIEMSKEDMKLSLDEIAQDTEVDTDQFVKRASDAAAGKKTVNTELDGDTDNSKTMLYAVGGVALLGFGYMLTQKK